jgi:tetratricopeptide (TPR) repeat protein
MQSRSAFLGIAGVAIMSVTLLSVGCAPSNPNAEAARREYFTALEGQEQWMPLEEQLEHINRAVQLDPQSPAYLQARAGYYASFGILDKAESDLDGAIALGSQPYLHYLRGAVRCERRKFTAAITDFNLAIEAQPRNTQFYVDRSIALTGAQRPKEALVDAAHVISEQPNSADGFYARGVARAALGQSRGAIEDLSFVISERPELAYPLFARARIYEQLGHTDQANDDRDAASHDSHWGWAPCRHMDDPRPQ